MKVYNENLEMKCNISTDLIYVPGCGICKDIGGKIQYFIDIDIDKCFVNKNNLFTLLQLVIIKENNIPVNFINEVIASDKNDFAILLTYINENQYSLKIGGRIGRTQFSEEFQCDLDFDEKKLIKSIVKSLDQKMRDGKMYRS